MKKLFRSAGADVPASLVVFLVALPLCLGIAQASGAPLFAGVIAGVVGGIVIGVLSGSPLSVSGPAAGLTAIVAVALKDLPSFQIFLLSVVLAGIFQLILGSIKAGFIGDFIPNSVITGMLSAIGLILILKEVPHLVGYDKDYFGDEAFTQKNGENTFSTILNSWHALTTSPLVIGGLSLGVLFLWEMKALKTKKFFQLVPAPLVVVCLGIGLNYFFLNNDPIHALHAEHLVSLPITNGAKEVADLFVLPDFRGILNIKVWTVAVTIAIVASLETLLSIEAVDKLDPLKRVTPTNRELKAQGVGNIISGLIGGLPVTSVIVRSSANLNAGGNSRLSTMLHGTLLMLSVLFLAPLLNKIPIAALAAILIFTGYKLAKPSVFKRFYNKGWDQFVPFVTTVAAILFTDLLKGILVGILVGLYFLVRSNFKSSVMVVNDEDKFLVRLRKDVSFLNKSLIKTKLEAIPENAYLLIDATRADFIDKDIIEEINNFMTHAHLKNIKVEMKKSSHKSMHLLFIEPTPVPNWKLSTPDFLVAAL